MINKCMKCGVELNDDNWYPSFRKRNSMVCKECDGKRASLWRMNNRDKARDAWTRHSRKVGVQPFYENKNCSQYLGVYIAERLLSNVFNDVEVMPMNNPGYDIKCNKGKKIDIKISCIHNNGSWQFGIRHNTIADYFLCMAINNREDIVPMHVWLLPGSKFNHLLLTGIAPSRTLKWEKYEIDIDKVITCCDAMKEGNI